MQLLETLGAVVDRHIEPVPHCARCDHLIGKHERRAAKCNAKGCWCLSYLWSKHTPKGGIPDLGGYFPKLRARGIVGNYFTYPVHFRIEVKRPGGRKRPKQIETIERDRANGVCAFFADSVEAMVKAFEEFGVHLGVKT